MAAMHPKMLVNARRKAVLRPKVRPFALEALETYIFTIAGQVELVFHRVQSLINRDSEVNVSNGTADLVLENVVSAEVEVVRRALFSIRYSCESSRPFVELRAGTWGSYHQLLWWYWLLFT